MPHHPALPGSAAAWSTGPSCCRHNARWPWPATDPIHQLPPQKETSTMASTIIDSRIFGDMFSDARMRDVWSDENRTAKYLDIERALAKVQGELGIIPKEAAAEIVRNCNLSQIDWDKLKAKTEQIGYPIIAVVNQINANCRDKLGEFCHWGATTQDITDTAAVLQMREGLALVEQDLDEI